MVMRQAENEESSQIVKDGRTRDIWAAVRWLGQKAGRQNMATY